MRRGKDDDAPNTWGAEEFHDWGVPPPGDAPTQTVSEESSSVPDATGVDVGVSPLPFDPDQATLSDHDDPDTVPGVASWAMEDRRHAARRAEPDEDEVVRCRLGDGDSALYVIDDGWDHCMICRVVGADTEGCVYCLVARITRERFVELRDGDARLDDAFSDAHDISLSSVFESESVTNVVHVAHYRRVEDVPLEYLPPSPFIPFTDS